MDMKKSKANQTPDTNAYESTRDCPVECQTKWKSPLDQVVHLGEQVFRSIAATAAPVKARRRRRARILIPIISALAIFAQSATAAEQPQNTTGSLVVAGAATAVAKMCASKGSAALAVVAAPTVSPLCLGVLAGLIAVDIYSIVVEKN